MKKIYSYRFFIPLFLLAFLLFPSCSNKKDGAAKGLHIVAANFVSYDFARAICKDKANLKLLIKPGMEIHSFDPSPMDIISLENADLFIFTGGESDEWAEKILASMKNPPKKLFLLVENAEILEEELVEGMETDEKDGEAATSDENLSDFEIDEHVWTSPENACRILKSLEKTISAMDLENSDFYKENTENYIEKIHSVQKKIKSAVLEKENPFIVMGDRFPLRYFTEEFGITYRAAFPGCSSAVEASPQTIAYLIDTVKKQQLPAVFTIELSNQKIARTIAEATGTKVIELNACHNLTKQQFDQGFTYLDALEQNLRALEEGLR